MAGLIPDTTGVILVGGRSRRMGRDKALLPLGGKPLIEHILTVFRTCFDRCILVGDRPERFLAYGVPIIPDRYPGSSLGGLYTGICHGEGNPVFVSSCDMPFLQGDLIRLICAGLGESDGAVPMTRTGLEPLCACYRASCLPVMEAALMEGRFKIVSVLERLRVNVIGPEVLERYDPSGRSLRNLNTPQEYDACRAEQ